LSTVIFSPIQDEPESKGGFRYEISLKGLASWRLNIGVHQAEKLSLEEIRRFIEAREAIRFASVNRQQVYGWVELLLVWQEYCQQGKAARGPVRRYIEQMTGLSRAQVTRLIARSTDNCCFASSPELVRPTQNRSPRVRE
jgi:hypothetical protein